ncbi:MAG: putative lipid II flippase FtsW [Deltaproteobacteria bacterium]|nr:putative lipid II flippase FtsW [Deltaproteobacteria bacterium]
MSRPVPRRYSPRSNANGAVHKPRALAANALDGGVIAAFSVLAGAGLVMIYSLTAPLSDASALPPQFIRQLVTLVTSILVLIAALRVPLAVWRRLALPLWGVSVALLFATLIIGIEVNGARRWLALPGLRLQAAEIAKFATVLAVAVLLTAKPSRKTHLKPIFGAAALCVPPIALLLLQPDFGSSLVLCAAVGVLLFAAGTPMRYLIPPAVLSLGGAAVYIALRPYAHLRWIGFLDPWATATREGFQLVQSFVAFARGGIFGVGLGGGRQKLYYLPEAHTDFILAGIAEELGLIGVLAVLGAFAALVWAGARIAQRAREPLAALVAIGMTSLIGIPAAINASVVMGLLPTTGFTLPFVSYGGNSLLICSLAVGILLRIGACEAAPVQTRISDASRRRIGRR